ncbi:MAG TPA: histidine phosphatase family protein, partial [Marmoricola sp.]|nr:histidine phosphatase family protein [Marmoricola sp.]
MKLYLVRHGETGSNLIGALDTAVPGADLSDTGRDQAVELAQRFEGIHLDGLYASTLARTQQT